MSDAQIPIYGIFKSRTVDGTLIDDYAVIGGYRSVETIAERNALLSTKKCKAGMAVYVTAKDKLYILQQNKRQWKEYASNEDTSITTKPSSIPTASLTAGTIALVNTDTSAEFEQFICAYIVSIEDGVAELSYFGVVKPVNMPANAQFGDKVYIDVHGTLMTTITASGKYKYVGNIVVDASNELAVFISGVQENYNVII